MIGSLHHRLWFRATCSLLAGLLAWLAVPRGMPAAEAAVGTQAKVYVFPYQAVFKDVPPGVPSQTTELLKNEIKHSEEVTLQKGPIFIPEATATPIKAMSDAELKAADKLRQEGETLYQQLRFNDAATKLQTALNKYEASLALLPDFGPIVDALLMLSVCYYRIDNEDEGAKMLVKVIRLQPDLALDPEKYPPVFRNTAEGLKKKLLLKARGEIEVAANEEGASVFFDGRKVGTTPVLLKELVPGEHYLRVEKEGLQSWADKVTVVSTQRKPVLAALGGVKKSSGPLGEISDGLRANQISATVLERVQQQGKEIGADFVVLGGVAKVGSAFKVSTFMVRVSTRELCPLPEIQLDADMLGASVEVYNMASVLFKRVEGCPSPASAPVAVVSTAKAKVTEVKAVAIGPAMPAPETKPPEGKQPEPGPTKGPATPSGPAVKVATPGGPATPRGPAVPGSQPTTGPANPPPRAEVVTTSDGMATTGDSALAQPKYNELIVPKNAEVVKPIDEVEDKGPHWYTSWWFWTLVGAAAVGGAMGGMAAGGLFSSKASGASVTVTWPQ